MGKYCRSGKRSVPLARALGEEIGVGKRCPRKDCYLETRLTTSMDLTYNWRSVGNSASLLWGPPSDHPWIERPKHSAIRVSANPTNED